MNQYEIELRDKYFEKSLDAQLSCPEGVPQMNDIIKWANDFADDCMAERQKHLNKSGIGDVQAVSVRSTTGTDLTEVYRSMKSNKDALNEAMGHKVQGTECNR